MTERCHTQPCNEYPCFVFTYGKQTVRHCRDHRDIGEAWLRDRKGGR